jgi:hypothetical protein
VAVDCALFSLWLWTVHSSHSGQWTVSGAGAYSDEATVITEANGSASVFAAVGGGEDGDGRRAQVQLIYT